MLFSLFPMIYHHQLLVARTHVLLWVKSSVVWILRWDRRNHSLL